MIYLKKIMKLLVYLVLILILIFSSSSIYVKLAEYKKADDIYEEIRGISAPNQDNRDDSEGNHSNENNRYKELTSINSDYRFWLKIENTNIDYPVVQSQDNQYYLKHDFNNNYLASGSIFMDYRNNFEESKSATIYGHHMRNKTMFAQLTKFKDKDFFNQNNLITIEYKDNKYIYEVFSTYVADFTHEDYLKINFKNEKDKKEYLNYIKNRSLYKKDIDLNANDHIITLFTCSYEFENARTIVHGKLISKQ